MSHCDLKSAPWKTLDLIITHDYGYIRMHNNESDSFKNRVCQEAETVTVVKSVLINDNSQEQTNLNYSANVKNRRVSGVSSSKQRSRNKRTHLGQNQKLG